jgi:hypothetical protein
MPYQSLLNLPFNIFRIYNCSAQNYRDSECQFYYLLANNTDLLILGKSLHLIFAFLYFVLIAPIYRNKKL